MVRALLRAALDDGTVFELGTDGSWLENPGPLRYASIYAGVSYDARLQTPGWDLPHYRPRDGETWTAAALANASASFKLGTTRLAATTAPAVGVVHRLTANRIQQPAAGVFVFDFGQARRRRPFLLYTTFLSNGNNMCESDPC